MSELQALRRRRDYPSRLRIHRHDKQGKAATIRPPFDALRHLQALCSSLAAINADRVAKLKAADPPLGLKDGPLTVVRLAQRLT